MSQLRVPGEKLWYSPARDITVLTPSIIRVALDRVISDQNTFKCLNATETQCGEVAVALSKLCSEECILHTKAWNEAMLVSGLMDVPAAAKASVYACAFEVLLQTFYQATREATVTPAGQEPHITQYDPLALARSADVAVKYLRMPRWKRKLHMYLHSIQRWIRGKVD